jgi:hypothetical protein
MDPVTLWLGSKSKNEENVTDSDPKTLPQDLTEKAFEIAKRRQAAAADVLKLLEEQYQTTLGSHVGTVLYAASWLAGTSLYRSMGYKDQMEPGVVVLSKEVDQRIPALMKVFMYMLDKDGVKLKPDEFVAKIPAELRPRKTLFEIQDQFQDRYNEIMKAHGFDYMEGAKTGAVVCALLVKTSALRRKDLEPKLAASIVSMGFIEGAKTAPAGKKS